MKIKHLSIFAFSVFFTISTISCSNEHQIIKQQNEIINAYKAYYTHTEALLDTLEENHNWVDTYDPIEYYESKAKLDSILSK